MNGDLERISEKAVMACFKVGYGVEPPENLKPG